jgi:hypothetical protein
MADTDTWVCDLTLSFGFKLSIANKTIDQDADAHFSILKVLGRGGFGEVHHVRSKLSLEEYAVCNVDSEWPQ